MKKHVKILLIGTGCLLSSLILAAQKAEIQQDTIMNNTPYTMECTQVIGGYCANNPIGPHAGTKILPDPGSTLVRGHIMVMDQNKAGHYVDNIIFVYHKQGHWQFTHKFDLYQQVQVKDANQASQNLVINQG